MDIADFTTSEKLTEFNKGMAKFHSLGLSVKKDSENPHFKSTYAALPTVLETLSKPLNDCGLVVSQIPLGGVEIHKLLIRVTHSSSEFVQWIYATPVAKKDPQGFVSANTYAKRVTLVSFFGLPELDDDGNSASEKKVAAKPVTKEAVYKATNEQKRELMKLALELGLDDSDELRQISDYCLDTMMVNLKYKITEYSQRGKK